MKCYEHELHVRFGDVDAAGIAYFPRIYGYLHEVFESLWERHCGVRYHELIAVRRLGFPLVHSEVDFRSPLRFGDRPLTRVTCTRLGGSSFELHYRIFNLGSLAVDARQVTACVALDGLKPLRLPDEFRSRFLEISEESVL